MKNMLEDHQPQIEDGESENGNVDNVEEEFNFKCYFKNTFSNVFYFKQDSLKTFSL